MVTKCSLGYILTRPEKYVPAAKERRIFAKRDCGDGRDSETQERARCGKATRGRDPGAPFRQDALGAVDRIAGGLCRADRGSAQERGRGAAYRYRPASRR